MPEKKELQQNMSGKRIKTPYSFRERVLFKIAKGILGLDRFSITDDLIELGMDDAMIDAMAEGAVEGLIPQNRCLCWSTVLQRISSSCPSWKV